MTSKELREMAKEELLKYLWDIYGRKLRSLIKTIAFRKKFQGRVTETEIRWRNELRAHAPALLEKAIANGEIQEEDLK